jgi:hypothetical protein
MKRAFRALLVSILFCSFTLATPRAQAAGMREFILSCTYGVLAGTMMGAATLAFTDRPSDHLYRVARGASLGLYAGILLGAYVVFVVDPEGKENEEEGELPEGMGWNRSFKLNSEPLHVASSAQFSEPPFELMPLLSDRGVDGATLHFTALSF